MLYGNDRDHMRLVFCEAWRKHGEGLPLDPLETLIRDLLLQHPEYQPLVADPERALGAGDTEGSNPFLHLGLHLALREQLQTDRPAGVAAAYRAIVAATGDTHQAEHRMMACLQAVLQEAQQNGRPPDEAAYLAALHTLAH